MAVVTRAVVPAQKYFASIRGLKMSAIRRWLTPSLVIAALPVGPVFGQESAPRGPLDLIDRFDTKASSTAEQAGVGIAWAHRDGRLFVGRVLPGTPAATSGQVHVGDRLLAVGQGSQPAVDVKGMSIAQAVPLIRGTKRTLVILTLVPAGKSETDAIVVPLLRGVIKELNLFGDGQRIPPGTQIPEFEAVLIRGGGKYELKSSLGKVVVLEFWASWCGPCLKLLDHFQDLTKRHPEWKGRVQFVAIGIDEEQEKALRCVDERGKRWPDLTVVWAGSQVLKTFHIAALPTVYLLDRHGRVVATDPNVDLAVTIDRTLAGGSNDQPPK
jgi:thiol-disulfide isomerase/thioredoxin